MRAIKNEHLGGVSPGSMRFPADELDAWKMMLYWKIEGDLPDLDDVEDYHGEELLYTRAWVLGDRYDIKEFQDLVMLELLRLLKTCEFRFDIARVGFENTAPGSKLRKVMAEEIVTLVRNSGKWKNENFEKFDGVPGFTTAVFDAMNEWEEDDGDIAEERLSPDETYDGPQRWKAYMVTDGPKDKDHWIYQLDD